MLFSGNGRRHSLEMGSAMLAPVAAIVVLGQLAGFAYLPLLPKAGYPAMSLGMFIYMLHRVNRLDVPSRVG